MKLRHRLCNSLVCIFPCGTQSIFLYLPVVDCGVIWWLLRLSKRCYYKPTKLPRFEMGTKLEAFIMLRLAFLFMNSSIRKLESSRARIARMIRLVLELSLLETCQRREKVRPLNPTRNEPLHYSAVWYRFYWLRFVHSYVLYFTVARHCVFNFQF